jgi:hypothetical protein
MANKEWFIGCAGSDMVLAVVGWIGVLRGRLYITVFTMEDSGTVHY